MGKFVGTAGSDRISGTDEGDAIFGGKGVDYLYGGAGNDCFVINLYDMDPSLSSNARLGAQTQDVIYDFYGAGGWEGGGNNDFIYLANFGAGSTLTFAGYGTDGTTHSQYYIIHSATTGLDYTIAIGSMNGKLLGAGDFNFYN
ncbi:hypothetical protein [Novosphingobium clariflavum]|uniref:Calcium-binding protein n=1 Tax=Novosphingobium clariflavum TaxID=2029884 RepID=A0ABV6S897_9SPHN|nr:hypothetical protein [Novosphingobium clariflavum]